MFKTETKAKTIRESVQQRKRAITEAVADQVELCFRQSEHSTWFQRACRQDDASFEHFIVGLRKGLSVMLLRMNDDCTYSLNIRLKARDLRNHLLNFLSAPIRGKAYRNKELRFLAEALSSDIDAELFVPINMCEEEAKAVQERVTRHSRRTNLWFNRMVKENHEAVARVVIGGVL